MNLDQILFNASGQDPNLRAAAEQQLQQIINSNPRQYIADLASTLANQQTASISRNLAALQMKNALLNITKIQPLDNVWETIDEPVRVEIRNKTLATLMDPDIGLRKYTAQAVATIARLDLPQGRFTEVLTILVTNSANQEKNVKHTSLMTLGYICEELPSQFVQPEMSSQILTAIAQGLMPEETDPEIKLVSGQALINSLKFIKVNISNEMERGMLIQILSAAAGFADERVREIAFRAFAEIAMLYYEYLSDHISTLWEMSAKTIQQDSERVAVQAIELWNSIADVEANKKENDPQAFAIGTSYIRTAASYITPILLGNIHRYEEDDEEWNLHKSCSTTIGLITQITENQVIDQILQYVEQNVGNQDYHYRESAIVLFGSVLDGPAPGKLQETLTKTIQLMLEILTKDPVVKIRETTAWTFGRICEALTDFVLNPQIRDVVLNCLLAALDVSSAKTVGHICWALINLADGGQLLLSTEQFAGVLDKLLEIAYGPASQEQGSNVRVASYSAISSLIENTDKTAEICSVIQARVERFVTMLASTLQERQNEDSQILICSVLQCSFSALSSDQITDQIVANFMQTAIEIFKQREDVIEEAIQAIGALATAIEARFNAYLATFGPYLIFALKSRQAMHVCKAGTMALGDLARALGTVMGPFLHELVPPMLENLQNQEIDSDIKLQSICALGDLAGATKADFVFFLPQVFQMIDSAAGMSLQIAPEDDEDLYDYLIGLRESILEFYVSLIQGLTEVNMLNAVNDRLQQVLEYAIITIQDQYHPTVNLIKCVLGLMGDVAVHSKAYISLLKQPQYTDFIGKYRNSADNKVREIANWAAQQLG